MQILSSVYPWQNPCLALTSPLTGIMARIAHTDYGTDTRMDYGTDSSRGLWHG
ncbi:MAG: hypothetical protein F6K40_18145 [Okeania sp. SIO3I5]|uniref:hypothetical protein n=1 Tax=Okeania sp. SIO3I5 TaxID=2607805 RepID=UPI0013B9815D|nr:hypothetical protein [Okeania sp. SIO3I5]NEQ38079.1 hypothetical protein [Okeania sp. SIO3I5]